MKKYRLKQSTRRFVISLAEGLVMPKQGGEVSLYALYAAYLRDMERFAEPISRDRFCRILMKNGYQFRPGLYGGYFEDVKFI